MAERYRREKDADVFRHLQLECGRTFVCRGGFERMRKPIWAILRTFNNFFKDHTTEEIADALRKIKCEVDRSSIYRRFEKFTPFAHEYLRYMPIRTGEHVAADESVLLFEVPPAVKAQRPYGLMLLRTQTRVYGIMESATTTRTDETQRISHDQYFENIDTSPLCFIAAELPAELRCARMVFSIMPSSFTFGSFACR